jgi:hypothetical protein
MKVGSSGGVDSRKCLPKEFLRLQAKKYQLLLAESFLRPV